MVLMRQGTTQAPLQPAAVGIPAEAGAGLQYPSGPAFGVRIAMPGLRFQRPPRPKPHPDSPSFQPQATAADAPPAPASDRHTTATLPTARASQSREAPQPAVHHPAQTAATTGASTPDAERALPTHHETTTPPTTPSTWQSLRPPAPLRIAQSQLLVKPRITVHHPAQRKSLLRHRTADTTVDLPHPRDRGSHPRRRIRTWLNQASGPPVLHNLRHRPHCHADHWNTT